MPTRVSPFGEAQVKTKNLFDERPFLSIRTLNFRGGRAPVCLHPGSIGDTGLGRSRACRAVQ